MDSEIQNKFVVIDWFDSAVNQGWRHDDPKDEPLRCKSAGWLVYDGKDCKVVAAHLSEAGGYSDPMTIPTACIRKIRIVKELKRQRF